MKKQILTSFGLSLVFMIAAIFAVATPANAQNSYGTKTPYEVPFDFYVGNEKLAAGKYEVQRVLESAYQIRSVENGKSIFVAAHTTTGDGDQVKTAKLLFNQYNQNHFLRAIYTQVRTNGRLVNESKTERRIKKESENDINLAKARTTTVVIQAQ